MCGQMRQMTTSTGYCSDSGLRSFPRLDHVFTAEKICISQSQTRQLCFR